MKALDVTDLHVYGGAALLSIGVGLIFVWAAGVSTFGVVLLFLGLRRP